MLQTIFQKSNRLNSYAPFITVEAGLLGCIGGVCPTTFLKDDGMSRELGKVDKLLGGDGARNGGREV